MTDQPTDPQTFAPKPALEAGAEAQPIPVSGTATPTTVPPTTPTSTPQLKPWMAPVAAGIVGILIGAGVTYAIMATSHDAEKRKEQRAAAAAENVIADAEAARGSILPTALEACGVTGGVGFEVGDDGRSLTFDNEGDDDYSGADYSDISCVFTQLDMPSSVSSHVSQTTSMDGRQEETWEGITLSWSYHPDRGLDGVLTVDAK